MKVHITLVGGQPAPVYNGIVATRPDKVVFVYSDNSRNIVDVIKREICVEVDEQSPLDTTNPELIEGRAQELAQKYIKDEITLNISSGLKSWSYLFGRVFDKLPNAAVVYMDQNNVLWNYRTMKPQMDFEFDMDVLFRLQGNPLVHYVSYAEYTEEDKVAMDKIISARCYNYATFNSLTTILPKEWDKIVSHNRSGCLTLSNGDYVEWERPDYVFFAFGNKRHVISEFKIESPHAVTMAFHAGWFEYKVARMLSHWRFAKDVRLNCIFPPKGSKSTDFPKNEIDVVVNTGSKILFVECKTNLANSTDIDKFRTAVKNYGGLSSKALFVTDNVMNPLQKEKCIESGIITFSLSDPQTGSNKEQALFKLLEEQLYNINLK